MEAHLKPPSVGRLVLLTGGIILGLLTIAANAATGADPDRSRAGGSPGKSPGKSAGKSGASPEAEVSWQVTAGISIGNARRIAHDFGLVGTKPLPPGIRKNLARGKPMPPGIAKTRLPQGFIDSLPHHPGYEWQQAGGDLVLVASASLVIADVLEGVFD